MCFLKYSETCAAMQYFGSTKRCDNGNQRDDNVVVANNNVAQYPSRRFISNDMRRRKCPSLSFRCHILNLYFCHFNMQNLCEKKICCVTNNNNMYSFVKST